MGKRLLHFACLLLLLTNSSNLFGQHDWTWTFGDSILMRFPGAGAPVVDTTMRTRYFFEESASYSDANGNLQIYASGDSSFNAAHKRIPNYRHYGSDDLTNGVLILPADTLANLYHVFYVSFSCNGPSYCLRHSLVR
ncbi:MAG: hypothetical protein U0176_18890, partial [Bacteroidia bacterium]